jgi:predicted DCC family thiol-disulfide oxidoreductase YuxK
MTSCIPLSVGAAGYGDGVAGLTVLYDEGCGFCTRLAARIARRAGVDAAAIGSAAGAHHLRDLGRSERYAAVHVVDRLGRRWSGGAAVARLLRDLPGGGPAAAVLSAFPGAAERVYRLVAGHRGLVARLVRLPC